MTQPPSTLQGQYAGFISRAIGLIIDQAILYIAIVTLTWLTTNALALIGIDIANCPSTEGQSIISTLFGNVCDITRTLVFLTAALAPGLYFIVLWWLGGQTIGDGVVGVRVMQTSGHGLSLLRAAARLFGYLVCVLSLGIGFLWVLVDSRRQGWHDKLAHTCVVYAWQARLNETTMNKVRRWLHERQLKRDAKRAS